MIVEVLLFAAARQIAGQDKLCLEFSPGATVGQLRERLALELPGLAPLVPHMRFALACRYAPDNAPLLPDQQVACIPPVSGG